MSIASTPVSLFASAMLPVAAGAGVGGVDRDVVSVDGVRGLKRASKPVAMLESTRCLKRIKMLLLLSVGSLSSRLIAGEPDDVARRGSQMH